ncbi:peptidoglycan D,D-transpeptidase FtsI family protein [Moraxella marmotae]|uniref:peptidoglycan D,D-transpeptidase FtsI family protein n=1 Tax=Moraxella marmotae TaxID=3344520 RepID=UPI0035F28002
MSKATKKPNTSSAKVTAPIKKHKKTNKRGLLSLGKKPTGASLMGGKQDAGRFFLVIAIMLAVFAAIFARAIYLQILNSKFYIDKGDELITSVRTEPAYRGMITDRVGAPLAANAPLYTVFFDPYAYAEEYYRLQYNLNTTENENTKQKIIQKMDDLDLAKLAAVANFPLEKLQAATKIDKTLDVSNEQKVKAALPKGAGSRRLVLLNRVSPEVANSVMDLGFFAIGREQYFQRYYLQAEPNAQILGYMSQSDDKNSTAYIGRSGIEAKYNEHLAGKDGKVMILRGTGRQPIQEIKQVEPLIEGQDIHLTIDSRLQYVLYKELEQVGRLQSARSSSGMVVDVKTGEVLAMGSWPSFNSNNLSERDGANERNRPVLDVFEPGSVMKPFTVAAALESGKYSTNSVINTTPGSIVVGGYTIRDGGNYGVITLDKLIQKSSNVASTKIALSLPSDAIANIQKKFGFGSKTALDFPAEASGKVGIPKQKELSRRATLSYGYGQQVTLAQLVQAYATLGNRGVMQPLKLVKEQAEPQPIEVIKPDNAQAVVRMMELVTGPGGTGQAAAINGYRVAGKTGTSRRTNPQGGYYTNQHRAIFVGLAPASNPRFAVAILVEDPRRQSYAGQVSAPVFQRVMKEALRLYNVPYDKPLREAAPDTAKH